MNYNERRVTTYALLKRGSCETMLRVDLARRVKLTEKDIITTKWPDQSDTKSSPNECRSGCVGREALIT